MPSYQYLIAKRLPELSIGFEDLKLKEEITDSPFKKEFGKENQYYEYSYNAVDGVIARLQVEMKERAYPRYYINDYYVNQATNDLDVEHYMAYYILPEKRLLLWNVSLCPKKLKKMSKVFKSAYMRTDREIYEVLPQDSCLDIELVI